jgi:hypothetical protein
VSKKKKEHCALREQIRIEAAFWQFPLEGWRMPVLIIASHSLYHILMIFSAKKPDCLRQSTLPQQMTRIDSIMLRLNRGSHAILTHNLLSLTIHLYKARQELSFAFFIQNFLTPSTRPSLTFEDTSSYCSISHRTSSLGASDFDLTRSFDPQPPNHLTVRLQMFIF